jgi:hypothetical protein
MTDFGQLWGWRDPALAPSLGWYAAVAANHKPAKVRIAATIPMSLALEHSCGQALWEELDRHSSIGGMSYRGTVFLLNGGSVGKSTPPKALQKQAEDILLSVDLPRCRRDHDCWAPMLVTRVPTQTGGPETSDCDEGEC